MQSKMSPELMTLPERVSEAARILATGLLRARRRCLCPSPESVDGENVILDFTFDKSVNDVTAVQGGCI